MRYCVVLAVLTLMVVACGDGGSVETGITGPPSTSPTSQTSVVGAPVATPSPSPVTTQVAIDVEVNDGQVTGSEQVEVDLGDEVDMWILTDTDEEIHVHGYDLEFELQAGRPFHLQFVADIPGIFEVELHDNAAGLFELVVVG